jgi:uncharacterized protein YecE (DUF72 family)
MGKERAPHQRVRIGTSGWHYDHWRGPFYPAALPPAHMLGFYAQRFDSVELNNSFYHLPSATAFAGWRDGTPPGFCFAVKANRYLTHMKKLKDPQAALDRFLPRVEVLGDKLGPILFQLPPRWRVNVERLASFLAALPTCHCYSFELRDRSWYVPSVYAALRRHNVAFCIYDLEGVQSPFQVTADFVYVRLHGPTRAYGGCYTAAALRAWARRVRRWAANGLRVFVYFDNDEGAYAVRNAEQLARLIGAPRLTRPGRHAGDAPVAGG